MTWIIWTFLKKRARERVSSVQILQGAAKYHMVKFKLSKISNNGKSHQINIFITMVKRFFWCQLPIIIPSWLYLFARIALKGHFGFPIWKDGEFWHTLVHMLHGANDLMNYCFKFTNKHTGWENMILKKYVQKLGSPCKSNNISFIKDLVKYECPVSHPMATLQGCCLQSLKVNDTGLHPDCDGKEW